MKGTNAKFGEGVALIVCMLLGRVSPAEIERGSTASSTSDTCPATRQPASFDLAGGEATNLRATPARGGHVGREAPAPV